MTDNNCKNKETVSENKNCEQKKTKIIYLREKM